MIALICSMDHVGNMGVVNSRRLAYSEPSSWRFTGRRAKSARTGIAISEVAVVERREIPSG